MRFLRRDKERETRRVEDLVKLLQVAVKEMWDVDEVVDGVLKWLARWEEFFDYERAKQRIFGMRMRGENFEKGKKERKLWENLYFRKEGVVEDGEVEI